MGYLPPRQQANWEAMLGEISFPDFATTQRQTRETRWVQAGRSRQVAGIVCEQGTLQYDSGSAAVCMAKPGDLGLLAEEAAGLDVLRGLVRALTAEAKGLAGPLGWSLPARNQGLWWH